MDTLDFLSFTRQKRARVSRSSSDTTTAREARFFKDLLLTLKIRCHCFSHCDPGKRSSPSSRTDRTPAKYIQTVSQAQFELEIPVSVSRTFSVDIADLPSFLLIVSEAERSLLPYPDSKIEAAIVDCTNLPSTQENDTSGNFVAAIAPAPFNDLSADVVLRSADGTDFYVFSWILQQASPVFMNMLAFPQPQDKSHEEYISATGSSSSPLQLDVQSPRAKPPVVPLSESRATLEPLLRMCYPFPKPPTFPPGSSGFEEAKPLLEAAHKYDLGFAAGMIEQAIAPFIASDPVQVYAFAARFRLTGIMEAAARASLSAQFPGAYHADFDLISGGVYYRLVDYRERCKTSLQTLSSTQWSTKRYKWTWRQCRICVKHSEPCPISSGTSHCGKCGQASWFSGFWSAVMARLQEKPCVTTLQDPTLYDTMWLKKALRCVTCREVVYEQIRKFLGLLADEAAKKLSEVRDQFAMR